MTNLYNQIIGSIYNEKFYKDLKNKNTSFTMFYLLKLSSVIALVATFIIAILFITKENKFLNTLEVNSLGQVPTKYIREYYPDDLAIQIKDGTLTTNTTEPITFPIPFDWFGGINEDMGSTTNIAVITTQDEFSSSLFDKYSAFAVFTPKTAAIYDQGNHSIRDFTYEEINKEYPELNISKSLILEKLVKVENGYKKIAPIVSILCLLAIFIGITFFVFIGTIIYALFSALVIFIISKLLKKEDTYGEIYLKAIHADTLYILLFWTIGLIFPILEIPFLNLALVIAVFAINNEFKNNGRM